jgi:hypothetical protein
VLSGRSLCDKLITRPEESYRLWCVVVCDQETSWMRRPWPTGGCRAKNKQNTIPQRRYTNMTYIIRTQNNISESPQKKRLFHVKQAIWFQKSEGETNYVTWDSQTAVNDDSSLQGSIVVKLPTFGKITLHIFSRSLDASVANNKWTRTRIPADLNREA